MGPTLWLVQLVALCSLARTAHAQDNGTSNATTTTTTTTDAPSGQSPVVGSSPCPSAEGETWVYEKGKQSPPICIVLTDPDTRKPDKYIIFYPEVDEFSLMEVSESWGRQDLARLLVSVHTGGDKFSTTKTRDDDPTTNSGYVVPFWTVIIELEDGKVQAVTWDDGCFACGEESSACISSTCAIPKKDCGKVDGKADCDLKVYIGWFGTDANGKYMTSAGKRLSRFRDYSAKDAFDFAYSTAGSFEL